MKPGVSSNATVPLNMEKEIRPRAQRFFRAGLFVALLLLLPLSVTAFALQVTAKVQDTADSSVARSKKAADSPRPFVYTASPILTTLTSSSGPVSKEYFGLHIHQLATFSGKPSSALTSFPPFSFGTFRLWDVTPWKEIQWARGIFDWRKLDGTIKAATAHGVWDFVFTFGDVPAWASANPNGTCDGPLAGTCYPPAHLADLDVFATNLVQRYCGVIVYYETWNESSLPSFWSGSNEQLLVLTQHIYKIVKDPANCGCTNGVCSPGGGTNPNKVLLPSIHCPSTTADPRGQRWLQSWLNFVGHPYPYADIAAFHGYGYTKNPEDIYLGIKTMRDTLAQYGLDHVELWNTEASWEAHQGSTQEWEASWLMRYYIVQAAAGVSRVIWYSYDNCEWGTLWGNSCGTYEDSLTGIRAPGLAYGTVENWLAGAKVEYCESHMDGVWACKLTRPNGYFGWVLWKAKGEQETFALQNGWGLVQYRDWQNHKHAAGVSVVVGVMPILLENTTGSD